MTDLHTRLLAAVQQRMDAARAAADEAAVIALQRDLREVTEHSKPHPPEPATWVCGTIRYLAQKYEVPA